MADSPHISITNQDEDDLMPCERSLMANAGNSIAKGRRVCKDSIQRMEDIIGKQEDRVAKLPRHSQQSSSHTDRLQASMKDSLTTYRLTLQQLKESADTLESICSMFEYECQDS